MTRNSRSSHYHSNDPFDPFNHAGDGIDPDLLAVVPDDPYSLLAPEIPIQLGDIKRIVGESNVWSPVEEHEVGHKTPAQGMAYARVAVPEGYTLAADDAVVRTSDLIWTSADGVWQRAGEHFNGEAEIVGDIKRAHLENLNQLLFVAQIDPEQASHRTLDVPTRHRMLFPGEHLRRGDKLCYEGLLDWEPVVELAFGVSVALPGSDNGNARYCRPVHPNQQNWYVDEQKGTLAGLGGSQDPWPSSRVAQEKIEAAARAAGVSPYGIIWNAAGNPIMVYDLPEPENTRVPAPLPPHVQAMMAEEDTKFLEAITTAAMTAKTKEELAQESKATIRPPKKRAEAPIVDNRPVVDGINQFDTNWLANNTGLTVDELQAEAESKLPRNFRFMIAGEEVKTGDLWYRPIGDDVDSLMWQAITPEMVGLNPAMAEYLLARKTVSRNDKILDRLAQARQKHIELGDLLSELGAMLGKPM